MFAKFTLCWLSSVTLWADWYVDQSNANCATATGTAQAPFCTISEAMDAAVAGDTIFIHPGLYQERLVAVEDLNLIGLAGETETIVDGGGNGSVVSVLTTTSVLIDGLTIQNGARNPNFSTDQYGAGISVDGNGELTLRNSTVRDNHLLNGYQVGGGGIGARTIGPIENGPRVTIQNSTICNNSIESGAEYTYSPGGGVMVVNGHLIIEDSAICSNTSIGTYFPRGAGVYAKGSLLVIRNSTVAENSFLAPGTATTQGGGIFVDLSRMTLINSTVTGNEAIVGSAIAADPATLGSTMSNCTVTQNTGRFSPVCISGQGLRVRNSIIANNFSTGAPVAEAVGTINSLGHNLIGRGGLAFSMGVSGDLSGTPMAPIDPLLGPLTDNGGRGRTHALLPGSPALDSANGTVFEPVDQRGLPRIRGSGPDMGSIEGTRVGIEFCNGDGGNQLGCVACPCGNETSPGISGGCLNSSGVGAQIDAFGSPSVTMPPTAGVSLTVSMTGGPSAAFVVLLSGSSVAPTNPGNPCFGSFYGSQAMLYDGLRCAALELRRAGARTTDPAGVIGSTNPAWGQGPTGAMELTAGFAPGQSRYFQAVFRDDPLAVCMRGLNTSQAIGITFSP